MPVFKIHHITKYVYDRQVKESVNEIRILPYQCPEQEVLQQNLVITGHPPLHTFTDYWGNQTGTFNLIYPHTELVIENKLLVRTTNPSTHNINYNSGFNDLTKEVDSNLTMLELSRPDMIESFKAIMDIVSSIYGKSKSIASIVEESCQYIYKNFQYTKGITTTETTVDEILEHQPGLRARTVADTPQHVDPQPVRQWLYLPQQKRYARRRRHARMGGGVDTPIRLGRYRPNQ
jgi:transglutaminase-like putative cysteine protease